jgi:hypothetical protein
MIRHPGFGVLLLRLLEHRQLDPAVLAGQAQLDEAELRAVLGGATPSPALLRRIAPALGWLAADMFALAWQPVPEDLAPLDAEAEELVSRLAHRVVDLPPERRNAALRYARSLPQGERTSPLRAPKSWEEYPPSFGGVLLHMLANRNLYWSGSARVLLLASGWYLSPSTIGGVGRGRVELSRGLLTGLATVLTVPAGDLLAMAGPIADTDDQLGTQLQRDQAAGRDIAELVLELRRLSAAQIRCVAAEAGAPLR